MNNNRQILDGYFYQLLNEYKRNLFNNCVTGFHHSASIINFAIDKAAWDGYEDDHEEIRRNIDKYLKQCMVWNYENHLYEENRMNKEYYIKLKKELKNGK